ncbi:MAG: hypothetical protein WA064_04750 [Candidatus Moraniibacteriota bacterium]
MERINRCDHLTALIKANCIEKALEIIISEKECHLASSAVCAALNCENAPTGLIEVALEKFRSTYEYNGAAHQQWTYQYSQFSDRLWKRRLTKWIREFNEVSFRGTSRFGCHRLECSDRFVHDFVRFSTWSDDPAKFHLTLENLKWLDWKTQCWCDSIEYGKARIGASKFETEKDFLLWELSLPLETFRELDYQTQKKAIPVVKLYSRLCRLEELFVNTSTCEFLNLRKELARIELEQIEDLEK